MKNKEEIRELLKRKKLSKASKNEKLQKSLSGNLIDKIGEDLSFKTLGVLFKISIGKEDDYEIDVRQLLRITSKDLLKEAEDLPFKMAQFGLLINKLKMNIIRTDNKKKSIYAKIFKKFKSNEAYKKYTDTALSKMVEDDEEYKILTNKILKLTFEKDCLENIYWSLKEKVNIITKLSFN